MTRAWKKSHRCSKCGIVKPISEFHKQGRTRTGEQRYNSACKDCKNKELRDRWKNHKQNSKSPEWYRAYHQARSATYTRLIRMVPELFARIMKEECKARGIDWNEKEFFNRMNYKIGA